MAVVDSRHSVDGAVDGAVPGRVERPVYGTVEGGVDGPVDGVVDGAAGSTPATVDEPVPEPRALYRAPHVEPLAALAWSQAIELPRAADLASKPVETRQAWVHRAPETHVLALYRSTSAGGSPVPAPWWLRAVAAGSLASREEGFRLEDRLAGLLASRPGWVYVPWSVDGESGYWEFTPSERGPAGYSIPTTIVATDRHRGWIDVVPAHSGAAAAPIGVDGVASLRTWLGEYEARR